MNIIFSKKFDKKYTELPKEIQAVFKKKLIMFSHNRNHPSLRIKKMRGCESIYEGSVSMKYRFTFENIENGILLRNIGIHDEALSKP
jgi:mRNA interferase RelE/StbE